MQRMMGLRAMRNGLNEGRQAASSQDLCAKLAMVARLVRGGAVDHVALDLWFMRSIDIPMKERTF